jgi:hypothetical protein
MADSFERWEQLRTNCRVVDKIGARQVAIFNEVEDADRAVIAHNSRPAAEAMAEALKASLRELENANGLFAYNPLEQIADAARCQDFRSLIMMIDKALKAWEQANAR